MLEYINQNPLKDLERGPLFLGSENMEKNKKLLNRYVFLSTFARNLIELFIGTILFNRGFDLKSVIFY